jgi:uroporphyrinogen decarboxylase
MNEKSRVQAAVQFRDTHSVPWQIDYTTELAARIMDILGLEERRRLVRGKNIYKYNALNEFLGNHLCYLRSEPVDGLREMGNDIWLDEWGVSWDRSIDRDIGTPVNTVLMQMDPAGLSLPDPDSRARFTHFTPLIEMNEERYVVVKISRCLFERAWSLRGMEALMQDFILNPSFVHELLDRLTDYTVRLIKNLAGFRIDAVRFSDDWGGQRGLLISPQMWRAFLKPYLKRMYGQAHNQGYTVFIHSCGDISAVLDDLVEIGVNVFNPFQPDVMDIARVIERYAGRLAFYGGLSIQKTLPFGTTGEVRAEVGNRLELARRHGGYIIGPCHDMPRDVPVENVLAMRDMLLEQDGRREA